MRITVQQGGLNELVADLRDAPREVIRRVPIAVRAAAFGLEAQAKAFAPVDTGNLRNSIGTDVDADGLGATIGPTAEYGGFVEYGTSRHGPQAFMGPAFDRAVPTLVSALEQIVEAVL